MDIFDNILNVLTQTRLIAKWPEMNAILHDYTARHSLDWHFPILASKAVGGSAQDALPAAATIACMQIHLFLIDDLLDQDPRGWHHKVGVGEAANLAAAFQAVATNMIAQSQSDSSIRLAMLERLQQMVQTMTLGQHLDTQNHPSNEQEYWQIVRSKSSPYFGTALYLGALVGGASIEIANQLLDVGRLYGEMCQIHDDILDSLAEPANPDWVLGRYPLPILFAEIVEHPEQARFKMLRQSMSGSENATNINLEALTEAQDILVRSGAISYCIHELLNRYQITCQKLAIIPLVQRDELSQLLEKQVKPVWSLFQSLGVKEPKQMVAKRGQFMAKHP